MCLPTGIAPEREFVSHGLQCVVTVHPLFGTRCGYLRLPPGHPCYNQKPRKSEGLLAVNVHCGINFGELESCADEHADGRGHWVGFDCAHAFDFAPGIMALLVALKFKPASFPKDIPEIVIEDKLRIVREAYEARRFEWGQPDDPPPFDERLARQIVASHGDEHYWTLEEVIVELETLAMQLAGVQESQSSDKENHHE